MKVNFLILFLIPTIMMTTCEDDCFSIENVGEEDIVEIISLTPLESTYEQGTVLTLKIDLPASNDYFGDQLNLFEETDDESALVILDEGLFFENSLTFIKGSRGEFSNWFLLPYNSQTGTYELEIQFTLERLGAYSHSNSGLIYLGPSDPRDCSDFRLNTRFMNIDELLIEFTVTEKVNT